MEPCLHTMQCVLCTAEKWLHADSAIGKHDTICHNVSKLITCESCYFSNSGNVELDTPHYFTLAIMHVQCHLLAWASIIPHLEEFNQGSERATQLERVGTLSHAVR